MLCRRLHAQCNKPSASTIRHDCACGEATTELAGADLVRLELLHHVVEQSIVKVLASQEGVSVGGLHLKHTTCISQRTLSREAWSIDVPFLVVSEPSYMQHSLHVYVEDRQKLYCSMTMQQARLWHDAKTMLWTPLVHYACTSQKTWEVSTDLLRFVTIACSSTFGLALATCTAPGLDATLFQHVG